jgi:hypothetical protein
VAEDCVGVAVVCPPKFHDAKKTAKRVPGLIPADWRLGDRGLCVGGHSSPFGGCL